MRRPLRSIDDVGGCRHPITVPDVPVDGDSFLMMDEACRLTRDLIVRNPREPDLWDGYKVTRMWPFVTALYNGIEQALKMLLLAPAGTAFTLEQLRKQPYRHDLERLHAALDLHDQEHIELHFKEHRSLHEHDQSGLAFDTAQGFISHLNGSGTQNGLISWRYSLLDPASQIPPTNPWTMWELWDAICCRIKSKLSRNGGDCPRLSRRLVYAFGQLDPEKRPYRDFADDLMQWWAHKDRSALAAWVDLLVKSSRGEIDQVQASEALRPELDKMAKQAIEHMSRATADLDEQVLLQRVRRTDRDLEWDPHEAVFRWAGKATR